MSSEPLAVPLFGPAHRASWRATAELVDHLPIELWAVVGGQMVVLHASERGVPLPSDRQTTDGDVVVDVRLARQPLSDSQRSCFAWVSLPSLDLMARVIGFAEATLPSTSWHRMGSVSVPDSKPCLDVARSRRQAAPRP